MKKFYTFFFILIAGLFTASLVTAQVGVPSLWKIVSGRIKPTVNTWNVAVPALSSCDTIDTDVDGNFACGVDGGGGGGGADGNWVYFGGSGIKLTTTTNQVLINNTVTSTLSKLEVDGSATIQFVSSTAMSASYVSSSQFCFDDATCMTTGVNGSNYLSLVAWFATTTDVLDEGLVNQYYTDTRVGTYISSSSTIPHIGGTAYGDLLSWNGSIWDITTTSSLKLGVSSFDSPNVSQWTNNAGYLTQAVASTTFQDRADWTTHDSYPAGCGAGEYVSAIGDTLTCAVPAGGGSGAVTTSSVPTVGNLSYWTDAGYPSKLGTVATSSLTATSPLSLSQPISVLGAAASALSISTAGTWSGNAGTASAFAADPTDCGADNWANAIAANGNLTCSAIPHSSLSNLNWSVAGHTFDADLDINGNDYFGTSANLGDGTTSSTITGTTFNLGVSTAVGAGKLSVDSSGNVSTSGTLKTYNASVGALVVGDITTVAATGNLEVRGTGVVPVTFGTSASGYNNGAVINFRGASVASIAAIKGTYTDTPSAAGLLEFQTYVGSLGTRMAINNGNVGIGTTVPSNRLTVVNGSVLVGNGSTSSTLSNNFIAISTSTANMQGVFYVDSSGNTSASGTIKFSNLASCDTIDSSADGTLSCGTDDSTAGGAGTVATSTSPTVGGIAYWTSKDAWPETLGSVATTSLTGTSISFSNPISVIGGSASVASLNMANANTWTALQTFANVSSTNFTASSYVSTTALISSNLSVRDLVSCDTIDTDANGLMTCGTDGGGIGSSNFSTPLTITDGTTTSTLTANSLYVATSTSNMLGLFNVNSAGSISASGTLSVLNSASSTFSAGLSVMGAGGGLRVGTLINCDTINTDANGYMVCGVDDGGSGVQNDWGRFDSTYGVVSLMTSTTYPVWFDSGIYASTTLTVTGNSTFINPIYANNGIISGQTAGYNLGTFYVDSAGAMSVSSTLHAVGAVTFDSTLTVTGNSTIDRYMVFGYQTSTSFTGSTTLYLSPAYNAITLVGAKCETNAGSLKVSIYDGTNRADLITASTTIGSFTFSTNNTFTANESMRVDIGTPATSPAKVSCRIKYR